LVEQVEHAPDVAVHARDTGVVLAGHAFDLKHVQLGKIRFRQKHVQVLKRQPVLVARRQPGRVRLAVVQREQKRPPGVALEELKRVVRHDVDDKALGLDVPSVDFDAPRRMKPIRRAQVPFAEQPRSVSGLLQKLHPGDQPGVHAVLGLGARIDPVEDAQFGRIPAGD
jgi:hypothetical protein